MQLDSSDQRWSTIQTQTTKEEQDLLFWFSSQDEIGGLTTAPPKSVLVEDYKAKTGKDCTHILEKLIAERRFGIVYEDRVFLNALLDM